MEDLKDSARSALVSGSEFAGEGCFAAATPGAARARMTGHSAEGRDETMRITLLTITLLMLAGCNGAQDTDPPAPGSETAGVASGETSQSAEKTETAESGGNGATAPAREPEETREPNAQGQTPAFENQTRAPKPAESEDWTTETVAEGLEHPWALEFLPDGSMLVTERPGRLRHVSPDGEVSEPIAGVPEVDTRNQGGLLDVAVSPDFESSRVIFLSFSEPHDDGTNNTAVARARLNEAGDALEDVEVIFSQYPPVASTGHFGSRIVFQDADTLWITMGDRQGHPVRQNAQDPTNLIGSVARVNTDGSVPEDNPFVEHEENAPEIWSYGHRNLQAADRHPETGELWTVEHGPRGGDELNRPQPGRNYGWPTISYGVEYSGEPVYEGITKKEGMEQPVYYWDPVIAPSGMEFYEGDLFPEWQGDLFVGGLAGQLVSRLVMEDKRVVAEEWLSIGHRVRDVREGPDGALYLVTDEDNGKVMRIVPTAE
jgi:glucose/arabinose dehydrogenase